MGLRVQESKLDSTGQPFFLPGWKNSLPDKVSL